MPKPPKKKPEPEAAGKKPKRTGTPIHVWVDDQLFAAVAAFRKGQRIRPKLKDVVELALMEFLTREGLWPPKDKKPSAD